MNVCHYNKKTFCCFCHSHSHIHTFWVSYSSSPFVTLLLVYYWFVELREESNWLTYWDKKLRQGHWLTVWEVVEGRLHAWYCSYLKATSICHYDCGIRRELEAGVIGTLRILDAWNSHLVHRAGSEIQSRNYCLERNRSWVVSEQRESYC